MKRFVYGLQMDDLESEAVVKTIYETEVLKTLPDAVVSDIPSIPDMATWVNLKSLGAKGDGVADDTKAIQAAIDQYSNIYVPEGSYRLSETLKLKQSTNLIGLHPMATNFTLIEDSPAFGGFGAPKAMVEAPSGGTNILTGIGLYTAKNNYRAVACKWMAGEKSMINDVKFIGGHGTMIPGPGLHWKTGKKLILKRIRLMNRVQDKPGIHNTGICGSPITVVEFSKTSGQQALMQHLDFTLPIQKHEVAFMLCLWNIMSGMKYG